MNYQKIYNQIIGRAQSENRRKVKGGIYYETHHAIPRCIGGDDKPENLANLTAREHFLCHWLLVRIYPENHKLIHAFFMMCNMKNIGQRRNYTPSSRTYQEAKQLKQEIMIGREVSEGFVQKMKNVAKNRPPKVGEERERIGNLFRGKKMPREIVEKAQETKKLNPYKPTLELRKMMSEKFKDRVITWGDKISKTMIGRVQPREVVEKQRKSNTGKKRTEEQVQNMKEGKQKNAIECIGCGKMITRSNIERHQTACIRDGKKKPVSKERSQQASESAKKNRITCPDCGLEGHQLFIMTNHKKKCTSKSKAA